MANQAIELSTQKSKIINVSVTATDVASNLWITNKKITFIAITGGFGGGGEDRTEYVAGNSNSEKIYQNSKMIVEDSGKGFNGIFIQPGLTSDSTINTATEFLDRTHKKDDRMIIYGYSNGGDFAVELAQVLQKKGVFITGLITVDASDRLRIIDNITVDRIIPKNVSINYNYYQNNPDECGLISCSHGDDNIAEDQERTKIFNKEIVDPNVNHRDIEAFITSDIFDNVKSLAGS